MGQKENYQKLQHQLKNFISHTSSAIEEFHQTKRSVNHDTLKALAETIYQLEHSSDQIMRYGNEDDKIEMQIIQNIMHDQIFFHPHSSKKLSFFQAAKTYRELEDTHEINSLLQSCAEHDEGRHHLFTDLSDICEYVADWIRKEKDL